MCALYSSGALLAACGVPDAPTTTSSKRRTGIENNLQLQAKRRTASVVLRAVPWRWRRGPPRCLLCPNIKKRERSCANGGIQQTALPVLLVFPHTSRKREATAPAAAPAVGQRTSVYCCREGEEASNLCLTCRPETAVSPSSSVRLVGLHQTATQHVSVYTSSLQHGSPRRLRNLHSEFAHRRHSREGE